MNYPQINAYRSAQKSAQMSCLLVGNSGQLKCGGQPALFCFVTVVKNVKLPFLPVFLPEALPESVWPQVKPQVKTHEKPQVEPQVNAH